jgi:hypothetical protein
MLFALLVKFILLSVVRGITVDTFKELRLAKNERLEDTTEKCFICGIERLTFDRNESSPGFAKHVKNEHNLWNYVYFFIYLWEQDKDDDDGLEQYVRRCLDANDIAWFPIGRAICLNQESKDEIQESTVAYADDLSQMNGKITTKINELELSIAEKVTKIEDLFVGDESTVRSFDAVSLASEFKRLSSRSPATKSRRFRRGLNRAMTMNRRDYGLKHHSTVNIEPLEIFGIGSLFDAREHGLVSLRIVCSNGSFEVPRSDYKDAQSMKFEPSEVCVCSNMNDSMKLNEEFIELQIYLGDGDHKRFIGHIEVTLDEIVVATTMKIEKTFMARYHGRVVEGTLAFIAFTSKVSLDEVGTIGTALEHTVPFSGGHGGAFGGNSIASRAKSSLF